MAEGDVSRRRVGAASTSRFRPDIQGLRAIAVLAVVLYHADMGLPGGFVGVDVFLVVSGFVITAMLVNEHDRTGRTDLRQFYLRRIRRLLPALATLMVVVLALEPFLGAMESSARTNRTALYASFFNANTFLMRLRDGYFDLTSNSNPLLHLWTLAVEEQFYLGFPIVLIGLWTLRSRARLRPALALGITIAAGASFALNLALVDHPTLSKVAFYSAPTRAWEFLAGAALALWPLQPSRRISQLCAAAGTAAFAIALFAFDSTTPFPGTAALLPVSAAVLLLVGGREPSTLFHRTLAHPTMRWLGDRSYSWYLWHWPAIVYLHAAFPTQGWTGPVAAAASLGIAALTYRLVENPIRHRTNRPARHTLALGATCVILPILVSQALTPVRNDLHDRVEPKLGRQTHLDRTEKCNDRPNDEWRSCLITTPGATNTVMLIGDSNAGQFSEAFVAATHRNGYNASIDTSPACPFLGLRTRIEGQEDTVPACLRAEAGVKDRIARLKPTLIVFSVATDLYLTREDFQLSVDGTAWTGDRDERFHLWRKNLRQTVASWRAPGTRVLVVHPMPRLKHWESQAVCAPIMALVSPRNCGPTMAAKSLLVTRRPAVELLQAVEREYGAANFDPFPYFCPADACSAYRDGHWWWRDADHATVHASVELTKPFTAAIQQALE